MIVFFLNITYTSNLLKSYFYQCARVCSACVKVNIFIASCACVVCISELKLIVCMTEAESIPGPGCCKASASGPARAAQLSSD